MTRAADDFSAINRRMRELNGETVPETEKEYCMACDNGGWVYSSYQATGAPNFEECSVCHNPEGHPQP